MSQVAPAVPRPRRVRRVLLGASAAVIAAVAAAGGLLLWDTGFEGRVLPGVAMGEVTLAGLDHEAAMATIDAALPYGDGRLVLRAAEGDIVLPYSSLGRRADAHAIAVAALASGRQGTAIDRAFGEVRQAFGGAVVREQVRIDDERVARAVRSALAPLGRPAVDATITPGRDGPLTTRAMPGQSVDVEAAIDTALAAMRDPAAPLEVIVPVRVAPIPPTVDDASVADAAARTRAMVADVLVTDGGKRWKIPAERVWSWVTYRTYADGSVDAVVDGLSIRKSLNRVAKGIARPATSASFRFGRGGVKGVIAAVDGLKLDVDATAAAVLGELAARSRGSATRPVASITVAVAPDVTTAEATRIAPRLRVLGAWKTWFPISNRNSYGANIWRPAEIINGTALAPGATFDWWRAIWPVTPERGFGPGGVIRPDRTDPTGALGGGMCSSSTTLFNAALRAGLQIEERHNHRYYIDRYPLGLDATVSISGKSRLNLNFTNDMKTPIAIRGIKIRSGGRGWVKYQIWGIPDGRTVSIGLPVVRNIRRAVTKTVYVDSLPTGVRQQVEYPSDRMDVSVTRVVRNAEGRVIHRERWQSHYVLWNGLIEIGR